MKDHDGIAGHVRDLPFGGRTALVTGGAGFLGSWLCGVLLSCGAEVICLDNFSSGRRSNIAEFSSLPGFSCIEQDVSAPLRVESGSLDYVFHLASRASPPEFYAYPIDILRSNTIGTLNTLEVARKYGARYLFTSTSEIYGNSDVFPTPETYHGNVNALGVRGCYDEAKRAGEAYCMAYFRQYGVDIRIARIFNTYGPMMRADGIYGRVIPRFIDQALHGEPITVFGDGSQTRSFCYVSDQVEALLRLCVCPGAAGMAVNSGNREEITILTLAKRILELTGSRSGITFEPMPEDDPVRRLPDLSRAKELISWEPRVSLAEGLQKMIESVK